MSWAYVDLLHIGRFEPALEVGVADADVTQSDHVIDADDVMKSGDDVESDT